MNIEFTARADRDFADPTPQLKCRLASKVALLQKSPAPILLGREVRRQRRIWQGPVSRTIVSISIQSSETPIDSAGSSRNRSDGSGETARALENPQASR